MKSGPYDKWGAMGIAMFLVAVILFIATIIGLIVSFTVTKCHGGDLLSMTLGIFGFMAAAGGLVATIAIVLDALHERQEKRRNG